MLNKTWLVGLIGYIAYFIKQTLGIEVTDELINSLADFTLMSIAIAAMITNMLKHKKVEVNTIEHDETPNTIGNNR